MEGTADPNCEASRRDGSTSPRSQESRFALATQHPSALAASDSGMEPTGTMLKPNTPGSRSMRRPLSISTTAISPRAVLVTKANVPSCRDDAPAGWIGGTFCPGGWQTLIGWPDRVPVLGSTTSRHTKPISPGRSRLRAGMTAGVALHALSRHERAMVEATREIIASPRGGSRDPAPPCTQSGFLAQGRSPTHCCPRSRRQTRSSDQWARRLGPWARGLPR